MEFQEWKIHVEAKSLCWQDETLVDWVAGGARFELDGTVHSANVYYAYHFDAAVNSPSGDFAFIYERFGTKGLLLYKGKIVRELNRSFYHADIYEFPIAFLLLPNGHEGLVHCPENYRQLEIDDLVTGQRLSKIPIRNPADIFHTRLLMSPSNELLLSAGWVWHPWGVVDIYDINQVVENPQVLDGEGIRPTTKADISSATFLADKKIVLATSDDEDYVGNDDWFDDALCKSGLCSLAIFDLATNEFGSIVQVKETIGRIVPVGRRHVLALYEHPKLIELATGKIVKRWTELQTGFEKSSFDHPNQLPPFAFDYKRNRFAVADQASITVVQMDLDN